MLHFESDYLEGAHPLVLERLTQTNWEQTPGYGTDMYCEAAREKIRRACNAPEAEVHFMVGGTQTNATMITAMLRPYEGVVSAESGHINQHEAGAVEAGGHKVLALPHTEGKLAAADVDRYVTDFYANPSWSAMVAPGMVYVSHPTEYGTLYTLLAADGTDVTLEAIASLCDVFYIGGTKVGALFGEAVVLPRPRLVKQLDTIIKQRGVLLAKGRLLGIQFDTLFTEGLYVRIARHAIDLAGKIVEALKEKGYRFFVTPQTNQLFVVMENEQWKRISAEVGLEVWEYPDECHTVVRIATSWATRKENVDALIGML